MVWRLLCPIGREGLNWRCWRCASRGRNVCKERGVDALEKRMSVGSQADQLVNDWDGGDEIGIGQTDSEGAIFAGTPYAIGMSG